MALLAVRLAPGRSTSAAAEGLSAAADASLGRSAVGSGQIPDHEDPETANGVSAMPKTPGFRLAYFSAVETDPKVVFKAVPTVATATMIATEMPAAMRPYSMAVAPDSFRTKRMIVDI